jgi:hypothetical protein
LKLRRGGDTVDGDKPKGDQMNHVKKGLAVAILAAALPAAAAASRAMGQADDGPQPWVAGRCYRVTILDPEQQHNLRVVDSSRGPWVRVHADPILPRVPGTSPRNYVWLNTASVFTVEQISCAGV